MEISTRFFFTGCCYGCYGPSISEPWLPWVVSKPAKSYHLKREKLTMHKRGKLQPKKKILVPMHLLYWSGILGNKEWNGFRNKDWLWPREDKRLQSTGKARSQSDKRSIGNPWRGDAEKSFNCPVYSRPSRRIGIRFYFPGNQVRWCWSMVARNVTAAAASPRGPRRRRWFPG